MAMTDTSPNIINAPILSSFFLSLTSQRPANSVITIANEPPSILSYYPFFLHIPEDGCQHNCGGYILGYIHQPFS